MDIGRLMGFLATEKAARDTLQEDAARYRWLLEHPTFAGHCFIYLPGQVSAEIDKERAAQDGE